MQFRLLKSADIALLLPMPAAIDQMATAFAELSAGRAMMPQRTQLAAERGTTLVMPAHLPASGATSVKIVSVFNGNSARKLPAVTGLVVVLDSATGQPRALVDGQELTSLRSGAAGGLAARLLVRKDADTVALFGAGHQARAQMAGLRAVRAIRRVLIVSRTFASAKRLADELASESPDLRVEVRDDPSRAVREADVVVAATSSAEPVFDGRDLPPGTHVTAVGSFQPQMREVDEFTVKRSRVFVDYRKAAMAEAGELIAAQKTDAIEIGEVVLGLQPGRQSDEEITLFKSVGVAVQDAAAAGAICDAAERLNVGTMVTL